MRYMKFLFCIAACLGLSIHANAETPIDITVNGTYIQVDSAPVIENGRTLVPVRSVSNALVFDDVTWDGTAKKVTVSGNGTEITLKIGEKTAIVNGKKQQMDTAAKIINDRTYVPIRFVSEAMGADVDWNHKLYTVEIVKKDISVPAHAVNTDYTRDDLDWLAKIVHAEAQGESLEGKVAVANVILNRIESKEFPNSVYEVVFDRKYGVQFTPVVNGAIYNNPAQESYKAAKQALYGKDAAGKSLYFCNPRTSSSSWIIRNRPFYKSIGNHDFFL